jgi:N-sulfoglucosamine sulfohydrolase
MLAELAGLTREKWKTFQGRSFARLLTAPDGPAVREFAFTEHNWHDYTARERGVRSERFHYIRNDYPDLPGTPPADAVTAPTFQAMRRLRDAGKLTPDQLYPFVRPRPAEEFYDLSADPHELKNLAASPRVAAEMARHRGALAAWQKDTGDGPPAVRTPDEFDRETGARRADVKPGPRTPRAGQASAPDSPRPDSRSG